MATTTISLVPSSILTHLNLTLYRIFRQRVRTAVILMIIAPALRFHRPTTLGVVPDTSLATKPPLLPLCKYQWSLAEPWRPFVKAVVIPSGLMLWSCCALAAAIGHSKQKHRISSYQTSQGSQEASLPHFGTQSSLTTAGLPPYIFSWIPSTIRLLASFSANISLPALLHNSQNSFMKHLHPQHCVSNGIPTSDSLSCTYLSILAYFLLTTPSQQHSG